MESLGLESSGSDQGPARHREYTCALHTGPGPILRPIRGPGLSKNRAKDSTPSVTISNSNTAEVKLGMRPLNELLTVSFLQ